MTKQDHMNTKSVKYNTKTFLCFGMQMNILLKLKNYLQFVVYQFTRVTQDVVWKTNQNKKTNRAKNKWRGILFDNIQAKKYIRF